MKRRGLKEINDIQEEYREFFISYAVGWRILYRDRKLRTRLETDVHSPAQMRVNLVVAQFNEWYSAFDIQKGDELYIEEKDRIHFF
jgi:putative endopeptidase